MTLPKSEKDGVRLLRDVFFYEESRPILNDGIRTFLFLFFIFLFSFLTKVSLGVNDDSYSEGILHNPVGSFFQVLVETKSLRVLFN